MSIINEYFTKIICVNLDRRTDKWNESMQEFEKHGLEVERFSAIDGLTLKANGKITAAEMGCSLSHSTILKRMVAEGWDRLLILEDDAEFRHDLQDFFSLNIQSIPTEWDMLYLGGSHLNPPQMINTIIGKITKTYTTSHYGISLNMAKMAIQQIDNLNVQVDVAYSLLQPGTKSYTFKPSIAWQRPGFSDIQEGFRDYDFLK